MKRTTKTPQAHMVKCKKAVKRAAGRFAGVDVAALTREWEERLHRMDLGMEAGHIDWIQHGFEVPDMDCDERTRYKPPTGERLDFNEWPISLC